MGKALQKCLLQYWTKVDAFCFSVKVFRCLFTFFICFHRAYFNRCLGKQHWSCLWVIHLWILEDWAKVLWDCTEFPVLLKTQVLHLWVDNLQHQLPVHEPQSKNSAKWNWVGRWVMYTWTFEKWVSRLFFFQDNWTTLACGLTQSMERQDVHHHAAVTKAPNSQKKNTSYSTTLRWFNV